MAQVSSTHDKSAENGKEDIPAKTRSRMQRGRSCLLKAVSYFAGDMQPFAKWMQSIETLHIKKVLARDIISLSRPDTKQADED